MASDIELFARLAADIVKDNKASNQIPPEALDAEKAGEKAEPETTETPPETETEPPGTTTGTTTETTTGTTTETTTGTTTTTTTEKEN